MAKNQKAKVKGGETGKNAYYMVGDIMVYDPKLLKINHKKKFKQIQV